MTLAKLFRVLEVIARNRDASMQSQLHATGGGELAISFTGQIDRGLHDYLLRRGFIYSNLDYIYRPR